MKSMIRLISGGSSKITTKSQFMQKKIIIACLLIALLEGFAGLGIEIYAIRISATYIGSSISITGVILAMVLIAIAVGYWYGGRLSQSISTPREALIKAGHVLSLSAVAHAIACIIQLPLLGLMVLTIDNAIVAAMGVGLLFGIGLAFGSTAIPLITQFLTLQYKNNKGSDAGRNAGMMVAVTTIGSVVGSTLTPIVLLPYIGLMYSLALFVASLAASACLCTMLARYSATDGIGNQSKALSSKKNYVLSAIAFLVTVWFIGVNQIDTGYQTAAGAWFISDIEYKGMDAVSITDKPIKSSSSCWVYDTKSNCHDYGQVAIDGVYQTGSQNLVFLGGAGMAIPSELANRHPEMPITVIDIDKGLPAIIEEHFLKESLAKNISFIGNDARAYFARNKTINYDYMFIDAFQGDRVASNLYTIEALSMFKGNSKYIMANIIGRPNKENAYTQTLFKNWSEVFKDDAYVIVQTSDNNLQNIMLCNFACGNSEKLTEVSFFNTLQPIHSDNIPRLDRYYYQSI